MNGFPTAVGGIALAVALSVVAAVPVARSGTSPAITARSITGARLGLGKAAYKKLLGGPVRFQAAAGGSISDPGFQNPSDYTRLSFAKRKMNVYFQGGVDRAIQITTWNKAYRTAEGVGPCSTIVQLQKAYGSRLKPNPGNDNETYIVGRSLIFQVAPGATRVMNVSLYDGSGSAWNKPSGPLYFASYVSAANDPACR